MVIVREDLIGQAQKICPTMLDYKVTADADSMYNTPPCWSMYVCGLVFKKLLAEGGLKAMQERNEAKVPPPPLVVTLPVPLRTLAAAAGLDHFCRHMRALVFPHRLSDTIASHNSSLGSPCMSSWPTPVSLAVRPAGPPIADIHGSSGHKCCSGVLLWCCFGPHRASSLPSMP